MLSGVKNGTRMKWAAIVAGAGIPAGALMHRAEYRVEKEVPIEGEFGSNSSSERWCLPM